MRSSCPAPRKRLPRFGMMGESIHWGRERCGGPAHRPTDFYEPSSVCSPRSQSNRPRMLTGRSGSPSRTAGWWETTQWSMTSARAAALRHDLLRLELGSRHRPALGSGDADQ